VERTVDFATMSWHAGAEEKERRAVLTKIEVVDDCCGDYCDYC